MLRHPDDDVQLDFRDAQLNSFKELSAIKIDIMSESNEDHIAAHGHSIRHRVEIEESDTCGCFYCCCVFPPSEIEEWIDDGETEAEQTALCPHCGIDSVIGSAAGYPINPELLGRMNRHWF